jgi:hypothetical protein
MKNFYNTVLGKNIRSKAMESGFVIREKRGTKEKHC